MERERGGEGGCGKMGGPLTSSLSVITVTTFFSNYKAGAVWLSLRGMLGRARGTREGERRTPLLFSHRMSSTFLLFVPPKTNGVCYSVYDWLR